MKLLPLLVLSVATPALAQAQDVEKEIREKTATFTQAIVSKDLSVLDKVFETAADNVYYDINEGPLVGFERLKRVWTAAVTNFTISKFEFGPDMQVRAQGEVMLQVGSWTQTQVTKAGESRLIAGRATILWRKRDGQWKVFHYHASITPPRRPRPQPSPGD
jgi:ketosteroid isomerase-like protein